MALIVVYAKEMSEKLFYKNTFTLATNDQYGGDYIYNPET